MKKDEHYIVELTDFSFNTKTNVPIGTAGCMCVTLTIDFRLPTVYNGSMALWDIIYLVTVEHITKMYVRCLFLLFKLKPLKFTK